MKNIVDSIKSGNLIAARIGKHDGWCGRIDHLSSPEMASDRFTEVIVERPERIEHGGVVLPDLAWDLFDMSPDHLSIGLKAASFYKVNLSPDAAATLAVFFRVVTDQKCARLIRQLKSGLLFMHGVKTPDGCAIDPNESLHFNEGDSRKLERMMLSEGNRVEVLSSL